ncbi:hypothetical protein F5Y14DRAFT_439454 [Nemania sp. NC0429]|nr:hypothetical protein F5Y14DRAFT_439454 [Nemania sp. NC0429]
MSNTALTNLGPLPTNFVLPPSCARELEDVYKVYTTSEGWYFLLQGPVEQTSCYPSGYDGNSRQYYSPARCPTGFTSACQSLNVAGTVQETVVRCCPTYSEFTCQSTIEYGWQETLGCEVPVDSATMTMWTVSEVLDGRTALATSTGFPGGMNAYEVKVGFQSTDFTSPKTSKTRTTHSTQQKTPQADPTPHTPTSASTNPGRDAVHSDKRGLAGGAIAGIVIGVVAGLLIIAALAWLAIRSGRRRRLRRQGGEAQEIDGVAAVAVAQPPMAQTPVAQTQVVHEMGVPEPVPELDGGMAKYTYR